MVRNPRLSPPSTTIDPRDVNDPKINVEKSESMYSAGRRMTEHDVRAKPVGH